MDRHGKVGHLKTADFNFSNARAAIEEYLTELARTDRIPTQISNRVWIEFLLERHGIIPDVRKLRFGQSHAAWYACLLKAGSVRRVSRAESAVGLVRPGARSTESTIRRLTKGHQTSTVTGVELNAMMSPHPAVVLWERLFRDAEGEDRIENPSYWVERSVFLDRCAREGISAPSSLPDVVAWEEKIGLSAVIKKTLDAYYRRTGTTRDPMTAGAQRLDRQLRRAEAC